MTDSEKDDLWVSVIDAKEMEELSGKKKKIEWVMDIIKEEWLDGDPEFMKEIRESIKESI